MKHEPENLTLAHEETPASETAKGVGSGPWLGVLPKPYYADEWVTIYHANSRDLLPMLANYVLITDPPYGVNLGATKGTGGAHGLVKGAYEGLDDSYESWRDLVLPVINEAVKRAKRGAVFTGPHLQEQPKASAIGGIYCPAGAGRHTWGFKTFLPVLFYGQAPNLQNGAKPNTLQSNARAEANDHPCPKPLEWMTWLIGIATEANDTVLDPFMGSGTTLRAAKDMNRRAIGIEQNEGYCEIAARRMAQSVFAFA